MQVFDTEVEVSAELQHKLELLQRRMGLPSAAAVLEQLISTQIDRSVYQMTGIRPGPRLAIDNTLPAKGQEVKP